MGHVLIFQGKSRPFLSPLGPGQSNGSIASIDGYFGAKKGGEANSNCVINKVLFEQFKHNGEDKGDRESSCSDVGCYNIDKVPESRKRRNPFQGVCSYINYTEQVLLFRISLLQIMCLLFSSFLDFCESKEI